jgi:RES domain-containing protein
MRVWRIYDSQRPHTKQAGYNPIDGRGGDYVAGRWNPHKTHMLYTSASPSLAVCETLARVAIPNFGVQTLLEINLPDDPSLYEEVDIETFLQLTRFRKGQHSQKQTRDFGKTWLKETRSLVLCVPSIVTVYEQNFLVNPHHKDFSSVTVIKRSPILLDPRFFNPEPE